MKSLLLLINITTLLFFISCGIDIEKIAVDAVEGNSGQPKANDPSSPLYFEDEPEAGEEYTSLMGYGFVNSAKAVAAAVGEPQFSDVENSDDKNMRFLDMMKVPEVWATGVRGQNVVVAVIDTGVDYNHEDLKNNIYKNPGEIPGNGIDDDNNGFIDDVNGWDFYSNDKDPMDLKGHGTHVAGIIAAEDNGIGITGVAPEAKILPLKVTGSGGSTNFNIMYKAIMYAVEMNVDVINISMGGKAKTIVGDAVAAAHNKGIIVVSASGNEKADLPSYPARFATDHGLAVGSGEPEILHSYSNRAGDIDIDYVTAPGKFINSTLKGGGYGKKSGTSMASPMAAGLMALIVSAAPDITADEAIAAVTSTALNPAKVTVSTVTSGMSAEVEVEEMPVIID